MMFNVHRVNYYLLQKIFKINTIHELDISSIVDYKHNNHLLRSNIDLIKTPINQLLESVYDDIISYIICHRDYNID